MRILTVRQPWAWAIIHGGKDVENRSTSIAGAYRGPVAIHAAKELADTGGLPTLIAQAIGRVSGRLGHIPHVPQFGGDMPHRGNTLAPWYGNRGAIIGVVDLIGAHIAYEGFACPGLRGPCSEWAAPGGSMPPYSDIFHYQLANPRPLPEPIPYKGALGLRTLPGIIEQQILAQLGGEA